MPRAATGSDGLVADNRRMVRPAMATSAMDDTLHLGLAAATAQLARLPAPFVVLFERGDFSMELFAPRGRDTQSPHEQDEIYVVASGAGMFRRGDAVVAFSAGDALFVPAGVEHRFEQFSDDFRAWVIFFGPIGGYDALSDSEAPFCG